MSTVRQHRKKILHVKSPNISWLFAFDEAFDEVERKPNFGCPV